MSFTPISVQTTRVNIDGEPATGFIDFQLVAPMQNGTTIVQPAGVTAQFDPAGVLALPSQMALVLLANDDEGTTPNDPTSAYQVTERVDGSDLLTYFVIIHADATITDNATATVEGSDVVTLSNVLAASSMVGQSFVADGLADGTTVTAYDTVANTLTLSHTASATATVSAVIGGAVDLSTLSQMQEGPTLAGYIPWVAGDTEGDVLTWNGAEWVSSSVAPGGVESVGAADDSIVVSGTSTNPLLSAEAAIAAAVSAEATARESADTTLGDAIDAITASEGQPDGIATLDSNGNLPSSQLPSWFVTGAGSPLGVVTPAAVNVLYYDTTGTGLWIATNAGDNESWASVGSNGSAGFLLYNAAGGQTIAPIVAAIGNISDGQPVPVLLAANGQYIAVIPGVGSPLGVVTPSFELPCVYFDLTTPAMWQSTGTTNTDWSQTAGVGLLPAWFQTGSGSPQGVVTPNSIGCLYFDTAGEPGGLWAAYNTGVDNWISLGALYGSASGITFGPDGAIGIVPQNGQPLYLEGGSLYGYWPGSALLFAGSMEIVANDGPIQLVTSQTLSITVQNQTVNLFVYPGNPSGAVTASAIGDLCVDTDSPAMWQATEPGNANWIRYALFDASGNLQLAGGRIEGLSQAGAAGEAVEYQQWVDENTTLATAISDEATTRAAADTVNANAIATETARAENAEAALQPKMTTAAVQTSSFTAASNMIYPVSTASGAVTATLPASPNDEERVTIKTVTIGGSAGTGWNYTTIAANTGQTINLASGSTTTATHTQKNQATTLQWVASGSYWIIVSDDQPTSAVTAIAKAASGIRNANTIGILSDSLAAHGQLAGYAEKDARGWTTHLEALLGGRATIAFNDGVSGSGITDNTWPQRVANMIASGVTTVILSIGLNDLNHGATFAQIVEGTGLPAGCGFAPTITNLLNAGINVIVITITPSSYFLSSAALVELHDQINKWILAQAATPGVSTVDVDGWLRDPAQVCAFRQIYQGTTSASLSGTITSIPLSGPSLTAIPKDAWVRVGSGYSWQFFQASALAAVGSTSIAVVSQAVVGTINSGAEVDYSLWTTDGVHPNNKGALAMGLSVVAAIEQLFVDDAAIFNPANTNNLLAQTVAAFVQTGGTLQSPSGTGFPASSTPVTTTPRWSTAPAGVTISYVPRTDGKLGYWTKIVIPSGETGVLCLDSSISDVGTVYTGQPLQAFVEVCAFGMDAADNAQQYVKIEMTGVQLPVAADAYYAIAPVKNDPMTLPDWCVLTTPLFFMSTLGITTAARSVAGGPYTTVPLSVKTPTDIPSGSAVLLNSETQTGFTQGIWLTTNGDTPAGSTTLTVNSFTPPVDIESGASVSVGFPRSVPACDATASPTTVTITITFDGGGTFYFGDVGIIPATIPVL